jgi:hypothetical protein
MKLNTQLEGGIRQMQLAGNADLHALVAKLEARMTAQEKRIVVLEQENSELWQEVHRVSGNPLSTRTACTYVTGCISS